MEEISLLGTHTYIYLSVVSFKYVFKYLLIQRFYISDCIVDCRYDYENCDSACADKMMQNIEGLIQKPDFIGRKLQYEGKEYIVKQVDNYSYTDPVDGSKATKQVRPTIVLVLVILYLQLVITFYALGITDIVCGWLPHNIPLIRNGKFWCHYSYVYR